MNNFDAILSLKNKKKNKTHGTKKLATMPNLQLLQETNIEVSREQSSPRRISREKRNDSCYTSRQPFRYVARNTKMVTFRAQLSESREVDKYRPACSYDDGQTEAENGTRQRVYAYVQREVSIEPPSLQLA